MKTAVLIIATILFAGMVLASCQKAELAEPRELKNDPESIGDKYVTEYARPKGGGGLFNQSKLNSADEPEEKSIGWFSISDYRFTEATTVDYTLLKKSYVNLSVFNAQGEKVAQLAGNTQEEGNYSVRFDASELPEGSYTIKIWARHDELVDRVEKIKFDAE